MHTTSNNLIDAARVQGEICTESARSDIRFYELFFATCLELASATKPYEDVIAASN